MKPLLAAVLGGLIGLVGGVLAGAFYWGLPEYAIPISLVTGAADAAGAVAAAMLIRGRSPLLAASLGAAVAGLIGAMLGGIAGLVVGFLVDDGHIFFLPYVMALACAVTGGVLGVVSGVIVALPGWWTTARPGSD